MSLQSVRKGISARVVLGISSLSGEVDRVCGDCKVGKQIRVSHKKMSECSTKRVLEFLHMDVMGLMQVESLGGKMYVFVYVDDFSRYTWVRFIRDKPDTFQVCPTLCRQVQHEQGFKLYKYEVIMGKKFENFLFKEFCSLEGIF